MYFTSPEHRARFITAIQATGKVYKGFLDSEYASALYILLANEDIWNQASKYVNKSRIDIPGILKHVHLSSGYKTLVKLAGNLFNGHIHVDPVDVMLLDEQNFQVAMFALELRYHRHSLQEIIDE